MDLSAAQFRSMLAPKKTGRVPEDPRRILVHLRNVQPNCVYRETNSGLLTMGLKLSIEGVFRPGGNDVLSSIHV